LSIKQLKKSIAFVTLLHW